MKILVADDHDIFRRGLKGLLSAKPGWQVCGEAKTGAEAVKMAEELKPDVVLMDVSMPDLNGLEATRRIRKALPRTEVLILTLHFSDRLVHDILDAGARGYIMKGDAERDLIVAVESLANRRAYFTSKASEIVLNGFRRRNEPAEEPAEFRSRLTSREREIVQQLAEGKSSKEVAASLQISVKTAETHRSNIMRKLDLHSVSEIVLYAVRNQIVEV
jgi:DNA-binding NarL/FixJ family response regulator